MLTQRSAELKNQVKVHVQTISILQDSEERRWNREMQNVGHQRRSRLRPRPSRLPNILIDFGTSIAEREQVPGSTGLSPSSSSANSSGRMRSYTSNNSTSTVPTTPPTSNSESSMPSGEPNTTEVFVPSANLLPRPLQIRSDSHRSPPDERNGAQPLQSESYVPSLRRKQRRIAALPAPPDPVASGSSEVQVVAGPSEQVDYTSVRPTSNYLQYFNGSGSMQSVSGDIVANGQRFSATANVDPEFPQNLISIAYVSRLGLTIQPHETADGDGSPEVTIVLPGGEERKSSGEVVFQWSAGSSSHNPPFNVRCLVYEHGIRNLVLGRPFLDRRDRYWNGGEDEDGGEGIR